MEEGEGQVEIYLSSGINQIMEKSLISQKI